MLPPDVTRAIEATYGPVQATFTVTRTPEGTAPDEIKRQWVGIELPIRAVNVSRFLLGHLGKYFLPEYSHKDDLSGKIVYNDWPVSVYGMEAVDKLQEAGLTEAVEFWTPYEHGLLTFRHYEGRLKTSSDSV